jgi:small subunit ribosomal protein S13
VPIATLRRFGFLLPSAIVTHVARIAGVDIPRDKRIEISLTYIYGIGLTRAQQILAKTGVDPDTRVKDLSDADVQKLRGAAEGYTLEGDLRREEGMALKRLQDIGCLRGRLPGCSPRRRPAAFAHRHR